ncbi:FHA domain-containing protein [Fibrisoma montanum]|uniref:FHA domain-containing protein n=1 Tax=Fibrisoma montanum TaxID=2305895 RepID=A0A418M8Y6_9BACT|nr:FHA domain-containing protein [Fibrisoma montanum]RIV22548.1 FHA domain-containing protein [Fibrisoma montanum]
MANQPGGWLGKLSSLIIPPSHHEAASAPSVSNKRILDELVASFEDSIGRESVGSSMLFNAHFLIILHPDTYEDRMNAFPVIVNEAVRAFNMVIESHRSQYEQVSPVASSWFFKFGAGREFGGEPVNLTDIHVIGALTGILTGTAQPQAPADKVNVTRRVKQTNRYEKVDVDLNAFQHIDFREPGAFVVKFSFGTPPPPASPSRAPVVGAGVTKANPTSLPRSLNEGLAQLDYYIAETNQEYTYVMRDREIVVARKEPENQHFPNYLLVESAYVSNPHARIRFNESTGSFQITSFSRNETRVNEQLIPKSEPANPVWYELPEKAQILLNSMVTLSFQSSR